jgi:magnesium and cobalt transporter
MMKNMASNNDEQPPKLRLKYWFKRALSLLNREPQNINELITIMKEMEGEHILKPDILIMMERIATLTDTKVSDVMVPRHDMITINDDANFDTALSIIIESSHSRYPVLNKKKNEVLGILLAKDLLRYVPLEKRKSFVLSKVVRPVSLMGENKPLDALLRDFRHTRNHLAIVLNQYGAVAGLVTLEDVLEQIVGNIHDEHDDE